MASETHSSTAVLAGCLFFTTGCADLVAEEHLTEAPLADVREKCVLEGRGGVFSLRYPEGSYWISEHRASTLDRGKDPCSDLVDVHAEVLPTSTSDEPMAVLRPTSGWVDGRTGFLLYRKVISRGLFDESPIGVGLARIDYGGIGTRTGPLLFDDPISFDSAFLAADGFVYAYGCFQRSSFDHVCRVARVPHDHPDDRSAWSFFDGTEWSSEITHAASVLDGVPALSATWNGAVLAVHAGFLEDRVYARTSKDPTGAFSRPRFLFEGTKPSSFWIHDVTLHATEDARTFLITYLTSPENGPSGLRIVEARLR